VTLSDVIDREATYYISGPMSGIEEYNYPYFKKVAHRLRYLGLEVYSPVEIDPVERTSGMSEMDFWQECINRCLVMMENCDSIIMLQGWTRSRGARKELDLALDRSWPVYFYLDPPGRLVNMTRIK
jgi:hypothetical protein